MSERAMFFLAIACDAAAPPLEPPRDAPPPSVAPRHALELAPAPPQAGETDADVVARVVRAARPRVEACLQAALHRDPGLAGRVVAGWTIERGEVVAARIVEDTAGDAAFAACLLDVIRALRFPDELSAEVAAFPWVVSGR